ncbi:hypothetical protein HYC85_012136 [Camellia sinensis]|uniref:Uncharacterized protein n=1 Tax=Camellia sinensis TaxID=4442 RepID=A0A7J7HB24_CAMSI|nr:hypothetical protein HYC85_012136 [Camellia sinensis]
MDLNEDEKKKKKKKEKEKVWNFCNMPFWQSNSTGSSLSSSSSSNRVYRQSQVVGQITTNVGSYSNKISSMVMSLLPARRRLCLDPPNKLYFPFLLLKIDWECVVKTVTISRWIVTVGLVVVVRII